jgi:hypothetical protein
VKKLLTQRQKKRLPPKGGSLIRSVHRDIQLSCRDYFAALMKAFFTTALLNLPFNNLVVSVRTLR